MAKSISALCDINHPVIRQANQALEAGSLDLRCCRTQQSRPRHVHLRHSALARTASLQPELKSSARGICSLLGVERRAGVLPEALHGPRSTHFRQDETPTSPSRPQAHAKYRPQSWICDMSDVWYAFFAFVSPGKSHSRTMCTPFFISFML
jgi:hypothetical protein